MNFVLVEEVQEGGIRFIDKFDKIKLIFIGLFREFPCDVESFPYQIRRTKV